MIKTVTFNEAGGPITAKAVFLGNMVANYTLFLREAGSNTQSILLSGDNLNPEDDSKELPTPVAANDGKRLRLESGLNGSDLANMPKYEVRLEAWQDGKMIGFNNETGSLNSPSVYSLVTILLQKNQPVAA